LYTLKELLAIKGLMRHHGCIPSTKVGDLSTPKDFL